MKRKIVSLIVTLVLAITSFSVSVSANSGYARKDMKSSYSTTQYECSFWGQSNFWDVWWGADGESKTSWFGKTPYYADSISHKDILSCTGTGSMSIGASPSGPNASGSISGTTATYSYSVSDDWKVFIDFNYKHTGLLAAWNYKMRTQATVQFGSSFYTWGT